MHNIFIIVSVVKLGISERKKKLKNLPHGFDKSADLLSKCQNREEDFFKLCVLLRKSELYLLNSELPIMKKKNLQYASIEVITLL